MGENGSPWWLALAAGVVTTLAAAIGKLWTDNITLRKEATAQRREADERLAKSHELSNTINTAHKRDLRRTIGWPVSLEPPPEAAVSLVRDKPHRPRAPKKQP